MSAVGGGGASRRDGRRRGSSSRRLDLVRRFIQGDLAELRVVIVLAVIWAIFYSQEERFLSSVNLTNLVLQATAVGLSRSASCSCCCWARSTCRSAP